MKTTVATNLTPLYESNNGNKLRQIKITQDSEILDIGRHHNLGNRILCLNEAR